MKIRFGPSGIGNLKQIEDTFRNFKGLGISSCEIPFTYGIFIKEREKAEKIRRYANQFGIQLTIHAQYWINLNSIDIEKIKASKRRLLECLKVGTWLDAKKIVFHPGYYGKKSKEESYENIKREISDLQKIRMEKKYTPKLAPETTGKINVFGSIEEIARLVEDTNCEFCIDFAHLLARNKDYSFEEVERRFGKYKNWHIHFSGIEYGEKGEKRHKITLNSEWKKILENLPRDKDITIINESPNPLEDTIKGLRVFEEINN